MIKKIVKSESLAIGLAMFSMFFGAANVVFPLAIGQYAGDKNFYAMSGLILTAVIMPILGVIAMILFDGNYRQFFGRLGKIPGFVLALIIISLLGPLGSTPRCIALSYITLKSSFPGLTSASFSAIACGIIFLFTIRKNYILSLLGWVLTPLLLGSLITIIFMGLYTATDTHTISQTSGSMFLHGIREGYNTMDLLAAFFFSSTILNILRKPVKENDLSNDPSTVNNYINTALKASMVSAVLLTAIYIGFSYLAAFHGNELTLTGKDELLVAITMKIAGPHAGILVCVTVALACLTTAIALISAFTDFVQKELFKEKVSYEATLLGALLLTFFISTFEFTGISRFLSPILQITYPGLIVLTFLNIAYNLKDFTPVKVPVFAAFIVSTYFYFF